MKSTYLAVVGRIRTELPELDRLVKRTMSIWTQAKSTSDDYYVDAAALNLQAFYTGLERLFEVIADGIDKVKPSGQNWHQELLRQMASEIPGVRPEVISSNLRNQLDRYRGFRHVVRNVYSYNLDVEQVETLVMNLLPTMVQVSNELTSFNDFIMTLTSED
ncbi:MAG: hypothetical protein ACNA8H_01090 [Anaerolineales bacterium]